MKRKNLLVLTTLLLTQAAPVWSMQNDGDEGYGMNRKQQEHQNRSIQHDIHVRDRHYALGIDEEENGRHEFAHFHYGEAFRSNGLERVEYYGDDNTEPRKKQKMHHHQEKSLSHSDETEIMNVENDGRPINSQHIGFETYLPSIVHDLDPNDPLPKDLGSARQRVTCLSEDNDQEMEIIPQAEYPLRGQWSCVEDRNNAQNLATFKLKTSVNNKKHTVFERTAKIKHSLVHSGPEIPDRLYFDGNSVYQETTKTQQWENPQNNQQYPRPLSRRDAEIPTHSGRRVIYTEPFSIGSEVLPKSRKDYKGIYKLSRGLGDQEGLQGRERGRLIYSDGKDYYFPHVTQELWEADNINVQAGFFIASYRQNDQIHFVDKEKMPNGRLEEGLYHLFSVEEGEDRRTEKWQRLCQDDDDDSPTIEIEVSAGVSSIAGMGCDVPRIVPHGNITNEISSLKKSIKDIKEIVQSKKKEFPDAKGSVIVMGNTGVGKTTLIQGMAGQLSAQYNADDYLILDAAHPLPGFHIGHDIQAGTLVPSAWYDPETQTIYWDCPGFGDPRGSAQDIINAYAIHQLFHNVSAKVVLVTTESHLLQERAQNFLKSFDKITKLFPNIQQIEQNLSVVVTKVGQEGNIHQRIARIAQGSNNGLAILDNNPCTGEFLNFLNENNKKIALFHAPEQDGAYAFNREGIIAALNSTEYVDNIDFNLAHCLNADSRLLVGSFAQNLNEYLTNYMKTEASQRIINYCMQKIDHHKGSVNQLRKNFTKLEKILQQIPTDSPWGFCNGLKKIIKVSDISNIISQLEFLKKIKDDVIYQINDWSNALGETIKKIENLNAKPRVEPSEGDLTLKGLLLGTSDVKEALQSHPNLQTITVWGLNTLIIDADLTSPGTSCHFIAPQWKIVGKPMINLSGKAGMDGADGSRPGAHGEPGKPGQNGGHFYGKGFEIKDRNHLTVNTSGGVGGDGGNGADGTNGVDGYIGQNFQELICNEKVTLGELRDPPVVESSQVVPYQTSIKDAHATFYITQIPSNCTKKTYLGTDGATGGKGGSSGEGGSTGTILTYFDYVSGKTEVVNMKATSGKQGNPGTSGSGGFHGKNYIVKERKYNLKANKWKSHKNWTHDYGIFIDTIKEYDETRGCASRGNGFNTLGQEHPVKLEPLDSDSLVKTYSAYYKEQASNSSICPFIKIFPNLQ